MTSLLLKTILTQNILPTLASPLLWGLVFILGASLALRHIWLSRITLRGLEFTLEQVEKVLEDYKNDLDSGIVDYAKEKDQYNDHEQQLCLIREVIHNVSISDHSASNWKKNISLSRAGTISEEHKKLGKLREDIEHSRVLIAKKRNKWTLELTRLRKRKGFSSADQVLSDQ